MDATYVDYCTTQNRSGVVSVNQTAQGAVAPVRLVQLFIKNEEIIHKVEKALIT